MGFIQQNNILKKLTMNKEKLNDRGTLMTYNADPYKRTPIDACIGDKIQWKRNGQRGHVNAKILGFNEQKPNHVFVENWAYDWSSPYYERGRVWIKVNSVIKKID